MAKDRSLFVDDDQRERVLRGIVDTFHGDLHAGHVSLDTNRLWCGVAATNGGGVRHRAERHLQQRHDQLYRNFNAIYFNPNLGTCTVTTGTVWAGNGSPVYAGAGTTLAVTNTGTVTAASSRRFWRTAPPPSLPRGRHDHRLLRYLFERRV